jgi:hypothetical protein
MSRLPIIATKEERTVIVEVLPCTSPVAWQFINFQGEFNFDEDLGRWRQSYNLFYPISWK